MTMPPGSTGSDVADFVLACIDEDEQWARAAVATAGAERWQWVDMATETPVSIDPFTQEHLNDGDAVSLRSVDDLRPWPDFAISHVSVIRSGVAGHIARHHPARVLAECTAKRDRIEVALLANDFERDRLDKIGDALLRIDAQVYADRPGYLEDWRPGPSIEFGD